MTTVIYRPSNTRKRINPLPILAAGLVGLLLWRLGPAAAIGACMILAGRTVGTGRSTNLTKWLRTAARVRALAVTAGVALIVASTFVQVPSAIHNPADLRGAMSYLAVQCAGFIGAPLMAWVSIQSLRNATRRSRACRPAKNLSYVAQNCSPIRIKIAV